ncbi:MAG: tyrosine-type recombinase/integrase [Defluviitaleaceae bacterium]|nr:tyrosine-type recombinase/integrase [Defluviitaleaceae bacterium]
MALTQPIRDRKHVKAILKYYKYRAEHRNQLLIVIAIYTALRISDILRIRCEQVYDFKNRRVRKHLQLTEKKTGKNKIIELNKAIIKALDAYFSQANPNPNEPLILNALTGKAISRVHAYRIIREAADAIGVSHNVGCHSLRKTFGYHSWKQGTPPVVLMEIFNHSSYSTTKKYLGVSQDDQNAVYKSLHF